jgi:hypothetical protein
MWYNTVVPEEEIAMNFRGKKWLNEANYISEDKRERVIAEVKACREQTGDKTAGVRPAAYIGGSAIAVVTYNGGGRIWSTI